MAHFQAHFLSFTCAVLGKFGSTENTTSHTSDLVECCPYESNGYAAFMRPPVSSSRKHKIPAVLV